MGGGGHSNCNASLSQSNVQKNNRALVRGGGGGGGLKLEKNKCWNNNQVYTIKSTKKLGIGSPVFCTFAFTPNQITAA